MVALAKPDNRIAQPQGKSNEWYTPAKYIEAAREVMGGIDLDPASCFEANQTVRAKHYYTVRDDGLAQSWYGRVWLNPPYGRRDDVQDKRKSVIELFARKLVSEYQSGKVEQAVLLTTLRVDTSWFRLLWEYPICFADHHVSFVRNYDTPGHPGRFTSSHIHGTCFVYLGSHEQRFIDIFSQFGRIAKAIDTPRHEVTPIQLWEVQSC